MEPLDPVVAEAMRGFGQGDWLPGLLTIPTLGSQGIQQIPTPDGVVIVSQSCDVVQARVPYVHVAPLAVLNGQKSSQARAGRWIRYAHLPAIGETHFADISLIGPVHKSVVAGLERRPGLTAGEAASAFGRAVGRNFSRFAFPDEVSYWLNPLGDSIQSKSGNLDSAEGRLLERVVQFRIRSDTGWGRPPYELHLLVVVKPGTLPTFPDDVCPDFDETLQNWLYNSEGLVTRSPGEIAEKIEASRSAADTYWLWSALGDAWATRCKFKGPREAEYRGSISSMTSEVESADKVTLTMQIMSEVLDLDHLSDSHGTD